MKAIILNYNNIYFNSVLYYFLLNKCSLGEQKDFKHIKTFY